LAGVHAPEILLHISVDVELTANRFIVSTTGAIDIATAGTVALRRLPCCDGPDEQRWSAACTRLVALWHEDMPSLLDYGRAGHERFEAYDVRPALAKPALASAAVRAFLGDAGLADPEPSSTTTTADPPRLGLRLLQRDALAVIQELLDDGRAGQPRSVVCTGERGAGITTFLRLAAMEGRRRGYVSVSVRALERWPALAEALENRHALVLCDDDVPAGAGERWLLRLCRRSPAAHVLLRARGPVNAEGHLVLRLPAFEPDALAQALVVYPPHALSARHVRHAAVLSGGLPAPFLRTLRATSRFRRALLEVPARARPLRVAEARPAYVPEPCAADLPAIDHPWTDMLARADRLAAGGRRAAAERDLREIAAAASRRRVIAAATAANTRLGWLLLNRGLLDAAEALFSAAESASVADTQAVEQALGLAAVKMERGAFDAAESILRAARALDPPRASLALADCLAWQGRYGDLERCLAPLSRGVDAALRAAIDALLARAALAATDLPRAARLASGALAATGEASLVGTVADAHEILGLVHGALADRTAVAHHSCAALAASRRAGLAARMPRLRASALEALHACGATPPRRSVERLLAVAPCMTPLSRACIWRMVARVHPVARERHKGLEQLVSFITASGALSLDPRPGSTTNVFADDVGGLVQIQDSATDNRSLLRGIADWTLRRLDARAVHLVAVNGSPVACAGPGEPIHAARRVLLTHTPQPPWGTGPALEAAAPARAGGAVVGAIAVRWRAGHTPDRGAPALIATAAAFAAPALAGLSDLSAPPPSRPDADGVVGRSAAIARLRDAIARAGPSPFPVLIEGESGSGKELVARAIHAASPRRHRACVPVNCAALGDDLLEAELFGHVRGAFTGAHTDRPGLFEQADGGTLFLDEVSELSSRAQAKLLRALQDGEVRRVGENTTRRVDVRVVAASNRRLDDDVARGRFRQDLLFRLAVVRIAVPPLRHRREDIPLLIAHYWKSAAERTGSRAVLTGAAVAALSRYEWPGNVRELQNVMAALAVHVARGRIGAEIVRSFVAEEENGDNASPDTLEDARRRFEREHVAAAMVRCGGRHGAAARELGVTRQGLTKLLRRLSLSVNE
jgi:two-component system response regulator HydG